MLKRLSSTLRVLFLVTTGVLVHFASSTGTVNASSCIPNGQWDDVLYETDCCSGYAVPDSTYCHNPSDYGTTWASCIQLCGESSATCDDWNQQYPGCNYAYSSEGQCCIPEGSMCPQEPCL